MKKSLETINTNPFVRTFNGLEKLFKYNQLWTIILMILGAGSLGSRFLSNNRSTTNLDTGAKSVEITAGFLIALGLFVLLAIFIGLFFMSYANGIAAYVAWKTSKGKNVGLTEAFKVVTERFWTIMAVHAWTLVKVMGGAVFFIVPGIRAALRYQMALFPVFDENLTARPAMRRVKKLTKGHLAEILGITSVGAIIPVLGSVLTLGGEAVLYPQLKQLEDATEQPKVHWLNYFMGVIMATVIIAAMAWFLHTAN